jgi:hypothetical protein
MEDETHSKTISTRGIVTIKDFHHLKDLIIVERSLQPIGFPPTQKRKKEKKNVIEQEAIQPGLPIVLLNKQVVIELHNVFSNPNLIWTNCAINHQVLKGIIPSIQTGYSMKELYALVTHS